MEIQWLGHACFSITHNGYTVVIDPYNSDYVAGYPKLQGVKADKLLISHESYGHNYREGVILSGRPESDCPFTISTMEVWHDTVCGIMRGSCLIHLLETDGIRVAHMGDIGAPLSGEQQSMLFNLDAMSGICQILSTEEDDLWEYTTEDGKNMSKAIEFMLPFIQDKRTWPYGEDVMYWDEWPVAQPTLIFAWKHFRKEDYFQTWLPLNHFPENDEVIRNLPLRNPLIWM